MVGLSLTFGALLVTLDYTILSASSASVKCSCLLYTLIRSNAIGNAFNVFAKRRTLYWSILSSFGGTFGIFDRYRRLLRLSFLSLLRTCKISKSLIWFYRIAYTIMNTIAILWDTVDKLPPLSTTLAFINLHV